MSTGLSRKQHTELGLLLHNDAIAISDMLCILWRAFRIKSPVVQSAERLRAKMEKLRLSMENACAADGCDNPITLYWPWEGYVERKSKLDEFLELPMRRRQRKKPGLTARQYYAIRGMMSILIEHLGHLTTLVATAYGPKSPQAVVVTATYNETLINDLNISIESYQKAVDRVMTG